MNKTTVEGQHKIYEALHIFCKGEKIGRSIDQIVNSDYRKKGLGI